MKNQDMSRNTGKTLAMVQSIPDKGAIVVIHREQFRPYITRMIHDVRGADVLARCRIVSVGVVEAATGSELPTRIDHFVWDPDARVLPRDLEQVHDLTLRGLRYE